MAFALHDFVSTQSRERKTLIEPGKKIKHHAIICHTASRCLQIFANIKRHHLSREADRKANRRSGGISRLDQPTFIISLTEIGKEIKGKWMHSYSSSIFSTCTGWYGMDFFKGVIPSIVC